MDVEISSHLSGRYKVLADGSLLIYTVIAKDKGNVTCVPDNGIQPSPKATASLFVQCRFSSICDYGVVALIRICYLSPLQTRDDV